MNALTVGSAALVPANMRDALEMANMMASAGFLARELQTPGGALFVIEQAMRWKMSPFAVAMETSFIQGKPMFSGKVVAAAATSSGAIVGRLSYDYAGDGEDRTVTVRGMVRGDSKPREVSVRLKDARTNNRVWQTQPDQQLAYHGARVWARRHTPEVMLGVFAPEEFDEQPAEPREVKATVVDQRPEPPETVKAAWEGMAWPICDRLGKCSDFGDADAWAAELQRRVATIQQRDLMDDEAKRRAITQVRDANRAAFADLRERGYAGEVDDMEALFRKALGEAEGGE